MTKICFLKDDRDNAGFAYTLNLNHDQPLKSKNDISSWRFLSQLDWQYVHKNFHPVESFRDVEFAREYNLTEDFSSRFSEQMLHALVGFSNSKTSTFRYSLNWFSRITDYSAVKQELLRRIFSGTGRLMPKPRTCVPKIPSKAVIIGRLMQKCRKIWQG